MPTPRESNIEPLVCIATTNIDKLVEEKSQIDHVFTGV
jgi:hypothetical protein